ncbi:Tubulin polyglutamylase ttll4 [Geranomyces variabilis]|uniref:Tubulin polyglutamylase ttll4 n=1 Tax=Geranomyces variabilis TaxID=109894 RepID=A0AAD5XSU5_9FUNG|nr:Tubulin polyglutamylase ttll4 [Geranomyces variabilis]
MKRFLRRLTSSAPAPSTFGSHLDVQILRDRAAGRTAGDPNVPYIMKKFIQCLSAQEALQSEGLFRVSGSHKAVKELRDKIEKTATVDMQDMAVYDIPAVASVFKQWLRELPNRLVPDSFYPLIEKAADSAEDLRDILKTLPPHNFACLSYLCRFVRLVSTHEAENRMSNANLSAMFAPNVFMMPSEAKITAASGSGLPPPSTSTDQAAFLNETKVVGTIMTALLTHVGQIFGTEDSPEFVDVEIVVVEKTDNDSKRPPSEVVILGTSEAPDMENAPPLATDIVTDSPVLKEEAPAASVPTDQPRGLGKLSALGGSILAMGRKRGSTVSEQAMPTVQTTGPGSSPLPHRALSKLATQRPRSSSNPPALTAGMISGPIVTRQKEIPAMPARASSPMSAATAATPSASIPTAKRRTSIIDEIRTRFTSGKPRHHQSQPLSPRQQNADESEESDASDMAPANNGMASDQSSFSSSEDHEDEEESGSEQEEDKLPSALDRKPLPSPPSRISRVHGAEDLAEPVRPALAPLSSKPRAAVALEDSSQDDVDTDDEILNGTVKAEDGSTAKHTTTHVPLDASIPHRRSPSVSSSSFDESSASDTESDSELAKRSALTQKPAANDRLSRDRVPSLSSTSIAQMSARPLDPPPREQPRLDSATSPERMRMSTLQQEDRRKSVSFHLPQSSDEEEVSESASASTSSSFPAQAPPPSAAQQSSHHNSSQTLGQAAPSNYARSLSFGLDTHRDSSDDSSTTESKAMDPQRPLPSRRPASAPNRRVERGFTARPVPNRPAPSPPRQAQKFDHSQHGIRASADRQLSATHLNPPPPSTFRPQLFRNSRLLSVRQQAAAETASQSSGSYDTATTTSEVSDSETNATESESAFSSDAPMPAAARPAVKRLDNTGRRRGTIEHELAASAAKVAMLKRRNSDGYIAGKPKSSSDEVPEGSRRRDIRENASTPHPPSASIAASSDPILSTARSTQTSPQREVQPPDSHRSIDAGAKSISDDGRQRDSKAEMRAEHARKRAQTLEVVNRQRSATVSHAKPLDKNGALLKSTDKEERWQLRDSGARPRSAHPLTSHNVSNQQYDHRANKAAEAAVLPKKSEIEPPHSATNSRREMMALYAQIKEMKSKVAREGNATNFSTKDLGVRDRDDPVLKERDNDLAVLRALVASYREIKEALKCGSPSLLSPTSPTTALAMSPTTTSAMAAHLTTHAAARLACARNAANRPYELTAMSLAELNAERRDLKNELVGLKYAFAQRGGSHKAQDRNGENDHQTIEHRRATRDEKDVLRALYARFMTIGKMLESGHLAGSPGHPKSVARDVVAMKQEKKRIQGLLKSFQDDFERRNGRAVRTTEDREPVAEENFALRFPNAADPASPLALPMVVRVAVHNKLRLHFPTAHHSAEMPGNVDDEASGVAKRLPNTDLYISSTATTANDFWGDAAAASSDPSFSSDSEPDDYDDAADQDSVTTGSLDIDGACNEEGHQSSGYQHMCSTESDSEPDSDADSEQDYSFPTSESQTPTLVADDVAPPPGTAQAIQNLDDVIRSINNALLSKACPVEPVLSPGLAKPHQHHMPHSESNGGDKVVDALWKSLFDGGPQVLFFPKMGQRVTLLPASLRSALTWKISGFTPKVVRAAVSRANFALVRKGKSWLGCWGKHFTPERFKKVLPWQKVNHFPMSFEIGRKDKLLANYHRLRAVCGPEAFTYLPETYVHPRQKTALLRAFPSHALWIVKPPAAARGQGIRVINSTAQLPKKKKHAVIVSRYIAKPYLIGGRKFDLRLYVAVTSFEPLRIYLYRDGVVRFAGEKYSASSKSIRNRYIHLTNYSISRRSKVSAAATAAALFPGAESAEAAFLLSDPRFSTTASKWSLHTLEAYFAALGIDFSPILAQIRDLVTKTIISGHTSNASGVRMFSRSRTSCYELFGFDVLLDARLKPWLMEVNISPSLKASCDMDFAIKHELVVDLMNLVGFRLEDVRRCRDNVGDE